MVTNSTSHLTEGAYSAKEMRFALVAARFNTEIVKRLVHGAEHCLLSHEGEVGKLVWVPGAFELPLVAKRLAESGCYDGVICLGAVIRGDTPHFDYVAGGAASGVMKASLETNVPVIFSVLTTNTVEQAEARSGEKENNNGYSGALTAIEMAHVMKQLSAEEFCDLKL